MTSGKSENRMPNNGMDERKASQEDLIREIRGAWSDECADSDMQDNSWT
ncbi:MAG TPA: hypothetical protein VJW94_08255 [Candidatus Acidoferrum sp.]|nr:hypothetical protein [Candidatus Acidoferrum sp.]